MINKISRTTRFKKDYKRAKAKHRNMDAVNTCIRKLVADDTVFLKQHRDHALTGDWKGYNELHVESDLLLVYRIDHEVLTLVLVRLASHDDVY